MVDAEQPVLELTGIHKQFPGVKALNEAGLRLFPGEVHALMGQNGAGKSTLIKVLTGVYRADGGSMVAGRPRDPPALHAGRAGRLGISTVYQEVNLCPNLSVAENIFIGRYPRRFGLVDWRAMRREAAELLAAPAASTSTSASRWASYPLGDPADGGDRARAQHVCARAGSRRADLQPRRGRSRRPCSASCAACARRAWRSCS